MPRKKPTVNDTKNSKKRTASSTKTSTSSIKTKTSRKKQRIRYVQAPLVKRIIQMDTSIGRVPQESLAIIANCVEQFIRKLTTQTAEITRQTQITQVRVKDIEAATKVNDQFDFIRHLFQDGTSSVSSSSSSSSTSTSSSANNNTKDNSLVTMDKNLNASTEAAWEDDDDDEVVPGSKAAAAFSAVVSSSSSSNVGPVLIAPNAVLNGEVEDYNDY